MTSFSFSSIELFLNIKNSKVCLQTLYFTYAQIVCLFFCGRKLSEDQNLWIYFHSCGGGTEQDVIQSYLNVKHAITRLNIPSVFLVQILKSIATLAHFAALGGISDLLDKTRWSKEPITLVSHYLQPLHYCYDYHF